MNDKAIDSRPKGRQIGSIATLLACSACALLSGPVPVMSNAPKEAGVTTTAPAPGGSDRDRPSMRGPRDRGEPLGPRDWRDVPHPPPSTQEREEAIDFFRTYMKTRTQVFDQLREGRPAKARMAQMMVERFRRLQRVKAEDPVMFDLMIAQLKLQDEALSLLQQQRSSQDDLSRKEELEQELRTKVRELIDVSLQERHKRVATLEKMLENQRASLQRDEADPDALVNRHLLQLRSDAEEVTKLERGVGVRRGGGGMGPTRRGPATDRSESGNRQP